MSRNVNIPNAEAVVQILVPQGKNPIGEGVNTWEDLHRIPGVLDHLSGKYDRRNLAKMPSTTELFTCDYIPLTVTPENCRIIIDGIIYEVQLIDDPMFMHDHLEIYLKRTAI